MSSQSETFSVRLPSETRQHVDKLATLTKRSRSYIINEAVEAYVKVRLAYVTDLDKAVASAESGVGHSGEQVFEWMRSWGTAEKLGSPKPDLPKKI